MKTKPEVSPEVSTSAVGSTKPSLLPSPDGLLRLADWPACLADEDIAAAIKGAAYEGY